MAAQRPVGRSVRRSARHLAVGTVLVGEAGGAGAKGRRPPQRSAQRSTTAGAPGFIPVRLVGDEHFDPLAPAEGIVEIRLRGGDVVRVVGEVSAERLRAVVTAVRQAC